MLEENFVVIYRDFKEPFKTLCGKCIFVLLVLEATYGKM